MDCPNFEQCGGELRFVTRAEYDGDGVWNTFRGYSAELIEQSCACAYDDGQMAALEAGAVEDAANWEPSYD